MSVSVQSEPGRPVTVTFSLPADAPDGPVSVVGSFNGWTAGADPFVEDESGTRSVTVQVEGDGDGDIHFRYLGSDGVWFDDDEADEVTVHGGVIRLGPPDAAEVADAIGLSDPEGLAGAHETTA